ncbi:RNase H domain-containing protein [Trichonephila clavipes]|nr:RNase H domain-containing protein [Trichonephila clavipes]
MAQCRSLKSRVPTQVSSSSLDRGSKITRLVVVTTDHFAEVTTTNGVEVSVPPPRSYVIKMLKNKLIEDWESWSSNSNTGLRVKSYCPKPSLDINLHSSCVTHFLTNHLPFVCYLHRFKLKATPDCLCGSVGDADHYVFACPLTKDFHLSSEKLPTDAASERRI